MNEHTNDGKETKSMMWMMAVCCLAPLVLIFALGFGSKTLGFSPWIIAVAAIAVVAVCFFAAKKPRENSKNESEAKSEEKKETVETDKKEQKHSCCH